MRRRLLFLALLAPLAGVTVLPTVAGADDDSGAVPDEGSDRGIPGQGAVPADDPPNLTLEATSAAADQEQMTVFAAAAARIPIDDFFYDALVLEGTAREVCVGRLLPGAGWTFNEIVDLFGGSAGTLYFCRERWDVANDPDCNGTTVNPATNPNFYSTCWSNHARGRAIDVMVGRVGSGYNQTRGVSIVNWLLARDAQGNVNSNARRLGVQQILFADRCWNSDGDRGISSWAAMRPCGIGHFDHIHIDMTLDGANGNVSYWGSAPKYAPKLDTQVLWDRNSAYRQAVSWWNLVPTDEEGLSLPAGYDRAIRGDWSGDGVEDDLFLWDRDTGGWIVQYWTDGDSLNARVGSFSLGYDEIIAGDWDSDGRVDDMIVWEQNSGLWIVVSWSGFTPTFRGSGYWATGYDQVIAADLDGDGHLDDSIHWEQSSGLWVGSSWSGFRSTFRSTGTWSLGYDDVVVGDWSAGGDLDETLIWERNSGLWVLLSWSNFRSTYVRHGYWSTGIDIAAPGDYDTDGRVDDLFLYDTGNGKWAIWSFHRNVPSTRLSGTWAIGYDVISVGSFMD